MKNQPTKILIQAKHLLAEVGQGSILPLSLIALTFVCFALSPTTAAANDSNTKLGKDAFSENMTVTNDTARAYQVLRNDTPGTAVLAAPTRPKERDPKSNPQFGLIVEEVEKLNPNLVMRDKAGTVNTVPYEKINAMLLDELLKERKRLEEQQATISDLKKDFGLLSAQVKEQAGALQKVNAQLEMRRPLTRVARTYP
jgi:hypothetical protein